MNISSINSITPPEPLTMEMLNGWYKKLLQDSDLNECYYSIEVDPKNWKAYWKLIDKKAMSNRARRILRNRRKMK